MILHGVAEVFFSVTLMSLIARYGYRKLISTSFALLFFTSSLSTFVVKNLSDINSSFEIYAWISLFIGCLLIVTPIMYQKFKSSTPAVV